MISVKRYTHLVILGTKHPRICVPPTQFQNFNQNSKIEFPGNKTKIFNSNFFNSNLFISRKHLQWWLIGVFNCISTKKLLLKVYESSRMTHYQRLIFFSIQINAKAPYISLWRVKKIYFRDCDSLKSRMRLGYLLERKRRLEEAKNKNEIKIKKKRFSPRFCTICDEDKLNHKRKFFHS